MIYQFKVTLKDVGVPVWRRLQVDSETTFERFHYIILAAFDWLGYHLHEFEMRRSNGIRLSNTRIGKKKKYSPSREQSVSKSNKKDACSSRRLWATPFFA